jgi:fluoride ion exporter CrcB/FEX
MAGFCGVGTFSTFSGEGFEMLQQQQYTSFALYLCKLGTVFFVLIGYRLANVLN